MLLALKMKERLWTQKCHCSKLEKTRKWCSPGASWKECSLPMSWFLPRETPLTSNTLNCWIINAYRSKPQPLWSFATAAKETRTMALLRSEALPYCFCDQTSAWYFICKIKQRGIFLLKKKKFKINSSLSFSSVSVKKKVGAQKKDMLCPQSHSDRATGPVFTYSRNECSEIPSTGPGLQLRALLCDPALNMWWITFVTQPSTNIYQHGSALHQTLGNQGVNATRSHHWETQKLHYRVI